MSIALTALTASLTTLAAGQTAQITPAISGNSPASDTITGTDENGNVATVVITRQVEVLAASVDPADLVDGKAPAGTIVYTHSNPGQFALAVNGSGVSDTLMA